MMMNLRWKTIVSSSLFVFSIYNLQWTFFFFFPVFHPGQVSGYKDVRCRHPGFKELDPESTSTTKNHALIAFLTLNKNTFLQVWRWESVVYVCLWVLFGWEVFVSCLFGFGAASIWKPNTARNIIKTICFLWQNYEMGSCDFWLSISQFGASFVS